MKVSSHTAFYLDADLTLMENMLAKTAPIKGKKRMFPA
jgi:hypothetical protein